MFNWWAALTSVNSQRPADSPIQKVSKVAKLIEEEAEEGSEEEESDEEEQEKMEPASTCKVAAFTSLLCPFPPVITKMVKLLYTF